LHLGQDLRLDGHVQCGGGFVRHDHAGPVQQGDGDRGIAFRIALSCKSALARFEGYGF
jgi:hypothetical protein